MASIKIQSSSSGGGSITLTAPTTSSNRTVTLPDADVTLGNGYPAQAVGTLNGTGTISLETSLGISSATDVNTGRYDFNFSNNFSGTRYFSCGTCAYDVSSTYWRSLSNQYSGGNIDHGRTTGTARAGSYRTTWVDAPSIGLIAHGDLS